MISDYMYLYHRKRKIIKGGQYDERKFLPSSVGIFTNTPIVLFFFT